jgi:hypothetical protein
MLAAAAAVSSCGPRSRRNQEEEAEAEDRV